MNSKLREEVTNCFKRTKIQTEGDTELFDTEVTIDQILSLISDRERLLLDRVIEIVNGNRVDVEATRERMEELNATESEILNMKLEADDTDYTIDVIIATLRKQLTQEVQTDE